MDKMASGRNLPLVGIVKYRLNNHLVSSALKPGRLPDDGGVVVMLDCQRPNDEIKMTSDLVTLGRDQVGCHSAFDM
jgi:hypothetical protein